MAKRNVDDGSNQLRMPWQTLLACLQGLKLVPSACSKNLPYLLNVFVPLAIPALQH